MTPAAQDRPRQAEGASREARFFARHVVLHTHVEKAAGSTVSFALARMFGEEISLDLRVRGTPRPEALSPEALAQLRLLSGHFRAGTYEELFDRRPLRIATVRDPIGRILSFIGFLARSPGHPEYPRLGTLPPDAAVAAMMAEGHRMVINSQCLTLSGTTVFEPARRAAENTYLVVLPHAAALEVAGLFAEALRLPRPNPKTRRNAAPDGARPSLGSRAEALVRAATAEDERLVAWIGQNAERLLSRARERLGMLATAE